MKPLQVQLAVTAALLPLVYWVTWKVLTGPFSTDVQALVVGQVMGTALGASVQYWLGSSSGSARKDEQRAQQAHAQDQADPPPAP